jgi:protein TonB
LGETVFVAPAGRAFFTAIAKKTCRPRECPYNDNHSQQIGAGVAVAYRYNNSYSSRLNSGWRGSLGAILTIAIHAVVIAVLLLARNQVTAPATPLAVSVLSDAPKQQKEVLRTSRPVLPEVAKVHVPQPEILRDDPAPSQAIVASVAPPPPSNATVAAPPAPSQPRFDADYLNNPKPHYPPLSRRLREEGVVMLRVYVLPSGLPDTVELKRSSGSARLDEVALSTVRQWRFVPARSGDVAVAAWVLVPIAFSLAT